MSKTRYVVLATLLTLAWLCAAALPGHAAPDRIVTTQWLADNLSAKDVRLIDVRAGVAEYWQGHIPGAVYYPPDAMRLADHGVPGKLTPPEVLVLMLGRMGVSPDTLVVVYAQESDYRPAYLMWALDYLGHSRSAMLNGGFAKWQKEGRPVTQDYPEIAPVRYPLPARLHDEVRASLAEVEKVVESGGAVLLDVRPHDLYTGEKGPWKRKGHIKGAINHFWGDDLTADGVWKSKAELERTYRALGATPDKQIIVSCGQGRMSSHAYVTLKYILGYPRVKNYDGSFSEWSNIESLPIETGAK